MNTTIRKCLIGTCFAGGMIVLSATAANAADTTSGKDGLLSGTQVVAPVTAPISLGGTSLGLLGDSAATTSAPAPAAGSGAAPAASTSGSNGIGSGTQIVAPVTVPINLGSSSVGLLGGSTAASSATPAAPAARSSCGGNKFDAGSQHQRFRRYRLGNPSCCSGDDSHHAGSDLRRCTWRLGCYIFSSCSGPGSRFGASTGSGAGNDVGGRGYRVRRSGSGSDFGPC